MRLLGYSLTIVNIITPAMVLNLGSSYAIHVISEYFAGHEIGRGVIASTRKILRTILFACLTTVIGFLSLLTSKTGALKEFEFCRNRNHLLRDPCRDLPSGRSEPCPQTQGPPYQNVPKRLPRLIVNGINVLVDATGWFLWCCGL